MYKGGLVKIDRSSNEDCVVLVSGKKGSAGSVGDQ